jgi:hypothetical protein
MVMRDMKYSRFAVVAAIYAGFAVYLYQPYFNRFDALQYLVVVNSCLAACGCYVLSRRWVESFAGSLFAGAIYGFGPFSIGMAKFHPAAGLLVAIIPLLFWPAVFVNKTKWRRLSIPLSALVFLVIVLFFQISAQLRFFAVPVQTKLHLCDLAALPAPLVAVQRGLTAVGFYHVPIATLIIGTSMLLAGRRYGVMIIFLAATTLAFCDSVFSVSPIIWLAIPVLCCSVLAGAGMQGLIGASFADRRWLLTTAVIMVVISIGMLLLATKYFQTFASLADTEAKLLLEAGKMYILGTIAVAVIFFMARAKLRTRWLRVVLLCSAVAVDMFFGARFIVDKIL